MKSASICSIHDEPVSTVSYNSHQSRVLWLSWIVFPTTIDSFIRTCCCHLKNMTMADREKLLMMSPNLSWYGLQNIIFCTFPLLVSFQMSSQIACLGAVVHLWDFSPEWVFNVFSNCLPGSMHNRTGCICEIFHQSEVSYVALNPLPGQMHSRTGCTCEIFSPSGFLDVSSNW